jgi:hypothetical protein
VAERLSPEAIEVGTGRSWDDWLAFFDSIGAAELTHQEIVAAASGCGAPPWWRQMLTVRYEQHIGRRLPGQAPDGTFTVSASRTRPGSMDDSLGRWTEVVGETGADGVAWTRPPETTSSDRWRYWRGQLEDGSRVIVTVTDKGPDRSVVSVQHEQLDTPDAADGWRAHWKAVLASL